MKLQLFEPLIDDIEYTMTSKLQCPMVDNKIYNRVLIRRERE